MNGLNGFDYVAIALLAIGAIYGLQRGALRMVTSVVALAAAIYFASIYYNMAGAFAETQLGSSHTVGAVDRLRRGLRLDLRCGGNYRLIRDSADPRRAHESARSIGGRTARRGRSRACSAD